MMNMAFRPQNRPASHIHTFPNLIGRGQLARSRRNSKIPERAITCESMYPRLPAARMK